MICTPSAARRAPLLVAFAVGAALLGPGLASAEPALGPTAKIGPGLYELVVSPSADSVYVASAGRRGDTTATIFALDPKTLEVKGKIDVSETPAYGLGINQKTQTLYATDTRGGAVAIIDLASGKVTGTVKEGEKAHLRQAVIDEDENKAYVSVFGGRGGPGAIWVIDGAGGKMDEVITETDGGVSGLALDTEGNRLFVADMEANEILVVDTESRDITGRFPAGGGGRPTNIAFDAETGRLFVTNQESGDLTVLEADGGKLLETVKTGEQPVGVTLDPDRNRLYVANRKGGTVTVIDSETYEVLADLKTGTHPNTVAVDPRTGFAYVSNKAKSGGRGAPPVDDPEGDTVTVITP